MVKGGGGGVCLSGRCSPVAGVTGKPSLRKDRKFEGVENHEGLSRRRRGSRGQQNVEARQAVGLMVRRELTRALSDRLWGSEEIDEWPLAKRRIGMSVFGPYLARRQGGGWLRRQRKG